MFFSNELLKSYMPVAVLDGHDKMPVAILEEYSKMPVKRIDIVDPAILSKNSNAGIPSF